VTSRLALPCSLTAALGLALSGCFSTRAPAPPPARIPPAQTPPPAARDIPDAVPRYEPRSPYGNPPFYDVFGKRYYLLSSSADYVERGVASWYGPGFHKIRTSTGEIYDMYGMTAAHKTLPLPAYVRVTNLQNGRSIVVRVNDRGPFVGNRIIDLSYTAAAKLDMLRNGTAMVEVRSVAPTSPPAEVAAAGAPIAPAAAGAAPGNPPGTPLVAPAPITSAPAAALYVQAGAFADPANAERLAMRLRGGAFGTVFIRDDTIAGRKLYRVRIGPVPGVPEFDRIVAALEQAGVRDAHLALD
jgi:peptidoglycan lytic transglycosylase